MIIKCDWIGKYKKFIWKLENWKNTILVDFVPFKLLPGRKVANKRAALCRRSFSETGSWSEIGIFFKL